MAALTAVPSLSSAAAPAFSSVAHNESISAGSPLLGSAFSALTPRTLFLLPLRLIYRAEVFLFTTLPNAIVRLLGLEKLISFLAAAVANLTVGIAGDPAATAAAGMGDAGTATAAAGAAGASGFFSGPMFQSLKKFAGFFTYMTSKWWMGCFIVAMVLNRVTIYASTRRNLTFTWNRRLLLRIIPVALFITQILSLLRATRCQTSPNYAILRYGKPKKLSTLDYAADGGVLYNLTSFLLQWEDEHTSCSAVSMVQPTSSGDIPYGSFSFLWPAFLRLCLSHFVETLSCALQGKAVATEAGMSIFEHSLAFAEAETMLTHSIGLGVFGNIKPAGSAEANKAISSGTGQLLTRSQVLERLNVTPELLLITLISSCNSLTSNLLDIFGKQSRYRLINTTIWGLCFMACMIWGIVNLSPLNKDAMMLRFPTVCIVGFIPHLLILIGILTCGGIYLLALLLTAFSLPSDTPAPTSFRERLRLAHANMQGASHLQNIRISLHDDFYTTLVRIGYSSLTAASEAVFLNEGKGVVARRMTWLEEERLDEILASSSNAGQQPWLSLSDLDPHDGTTFGRTSDASEWRSGYDREKKTDKKSRSVRPASSGPNLGSVGILQATTKFYYIFSFSKGIYFLVVGWAAFGLLKLLDRLGITNHPQWLVKLAGTPRKATSRKTSPRQTSLDFWILTDEGVLELPENNDFDVEKEMRKREEMHSTSWGETQELRFDRKLYNWWKLGGAWGERDESGDYSLDSNDWDDTTSVISMSSNVGSEWESDVSEGRTTPTQENPYPTSSRSAVPEALIDTDALARLLDPKDSESRLEARILSSHLVAGQEGRIMTRSRFKKQVEIERARVLTVGGSNYPYRRGLAGASSKTRRPSPDDEAEILEKLILSKRLENHAHRPGSSTTTTGRAPSPSWEQGASGLGPSGPQCVVCQGAPRSIITWPCRCLCICEECRISLAMNNFGSCVTCRREVAGFMRLWVP
ncbi:hypothetical protein LOZ66_005627 [Ophidiomyces ophidiicola]|nr:hypothetical protein LOZ66_005627 [Ophidiomyces ophidiicola]